MTSSSRRRVARRVLGALSLTSASLMWLAPHTLARSYALPDRVALLRLLAIRDAWVGVWLLSDDPAAGVARFASDLLDAAMIVGNARSHQRAVRTVRGRLLAALLSASSGLYASSTGVMAR